MFLIKIHWFFVFIYITGPKEQPTFDVELCQRQLKEHYLQVLCKIPRFPGVK